MRRNCQAKVRLLILYYLFSIHTAAATSEQMLSTKHEYILLKHCVTSDQQASLIMNTILVTYMLITGTLLVDWIECGVE